MAPIERAIPQGMLRRRLGRAVARSSFRPRLSLRVWMGFRVSPPEPRASLVWRNTPRSPPSLADPRGLVPRSAHGFNLAPSSHALVFAFEVFLLDDVCSYSSGTSTDCDLAATPRFHPFLTRARHPSSLTLSLSTRARLTGVSGPYDACWFARLELHESRSSRLSPRVPRPLVHRGWPHPVSAIHASRFRVSPACSPPDRISDRIVLGLHPSEVSPRPLPPDPLGSSRPPCRSSPCGDSTSRI